MAIRDMMDDLCNDRDGEAFANGIRQYQQDAAENNSPSGGRYAGRENSADTSVSAKL